MKKVKYLITVAMVFILTSFSVISGDSPQLTKSDTGNIINRSAAIITTAQRFAAEGKKYDGLGLSLGHQLYARQLYEQGEYSNAGFHSLQARSLAAHVIALNKSSIINEALYNRNEEKLVRSSPSGQELDRRLKGAKVDTFTDQAAANAAVNLEV